MYAFEHAGVTPDVLVLSKAIGGGLPLAVIVYRAGLDVWESGAHAGTFRGNQLAMAAGLATLRYIQERDLCAHVERMAARFHGQLAGLSLRHRFVGDLRGRGLMLGIEIVNPEIRDRFGRPLGDRDRARSIQQECFRRGLLLELGGRNSAVLRLLPPLTITSVEVDTVSQIIADAMATVALSDGAREKVGSQTALA
jgi:diaminobutyrate-2-oxoglutarate transaminase